MISKIEELDVRARRRGGDLRRLQPVRARFDLGRVRSVYRRRRTNRASVDQTILEASLSGPLLQMPAGDAARGLRCLLQEGRVLLHRRSGGGRVPAGGRLDILGFNAADDIEGEDHNTDLYVEASIPLLADRPGVRSLEAVVGYRYSDYASAGGVDAYKAELLYRPVDALRLRSSYQHAVRAPSVYELYLPQLPFVLWWLLRIAIDPCEVDSDQRNGPDQAQVEALCLARAYPAELLPDYDDPDNDARGSRAAIRTSTPRPRTP